MSENRVMAKQRKQYRTEQKSQAVGHGQKAMNATQEKADGQKTGKKRLKLPVIVVFFVLVWLWAWLWMGDTMRVARENSFWSPNEVLMRFMDGRPWEMLCRAGRMLLTTYRWPVLGGALMALLVAKCTWLTGYCLRLKGWWKLLQFVPALAYLLFLTYIGYDLYYEAETGLIMGVPFLALIVLMVLALIIRSFSHSHKFPNPFLPDKGESTKQHLAGLAMAVLTIALPMGVSHWMRPYVRVTTRMQCQMMEQDWRGMAETARKNADLSYRQIAAYYAIALTQSEEQASRLFDIRMDYDVPYIHGFNKNANDAANYYVMDCDLYAGLAQTAIHHAMEHMTMNGPTLRSLKLLTRGALLKGEWRVAEKYLRVLEHVPFEGDFVKKYRPMVGNLSMIDNDPEFHHMRLTEPVHDNFENLLTQPTFMGYNIALNEGRSINALWNSLMVHLYTKTMPQFIARCQPLQGNTPPPTIAEGLLLMSNKYPEIMKLFPGLEYNQARLLALLQETRPFMGSHETRAEHAHELFKKWKGFYPYYYFFGNLKATKRKDTNNEGTSKQGVN